MDYEKRLGRMSVPTSCCRKNVTESMCEQIRHNPTNATALTYFNQKVSSSFGLWPTDRVIRESAWRQT